MSIYGVSGLFYFMAIVAGLFSIFALTRGIAVAPPFFKRDRPFQVLPTIFAQNPAHAPKETIR
jgi:hypothetical protein